MFLHKLRYKKFLRGGTVDRLAYCQNRESLQWISHSCLSERLVMVSRGNAICLKGGTAEESNKKSLY
ncbi:MAG: hypothetical protein D6743_01640 [Calditrichaeota bacterium]|nr:MAG: hypothetical protein D6743_01640 [Calditrichota bacterium]